MADVQKVILITGASSGLGRLTTETLARKGHVVFAGMRDSEGRNKSAATDLEALISEEGLDLHVLDLDVTDGASVDAAIEQVVAVKGRIDVLVNNAGIMNVGITEAYTLEEIQRQMDVIFYGPVRMD